MGWYGRLYERYGRMRRISVRVSRMSPLRCEMENPWSKFMTTNADTLFSAVRKGSSSLVMALALLAVCSPSWAADNGEQTGTAPGGLEIPPLVSGSEQPSSQTPPASEQGAPQMSPEARQQAPASQPPRKNVPREDIVSGTGQSFGGYSGTWHDAERDETVPELLKQQDISAYRQSLYIDKCAGFPLYQRTATKYYKCGEDMFPDMLEALRSAEYFIFMEYFIVEEGEMFDQIADLLEEKVKAGVEGLHLKL